MVTEVKKFSSKIWNTLFMHLHSKLSYAVEPYLDLVLFDVNSEVISVYPESSRVGGIPLKFEWFQKSFQ